jgi:hypothetical protein
MKFNSSFLICPLLGMALFAAPTAWASTPALSPTVAAPAKTATPVKKKPSYLFIVSAEHGFLKKTDTSYQLILKKTHPKTLYFSDRPNRKAGFMPTTAFLNGLWKKGKDSFAKDHPNAALAHVDMTAFRKHKDTPFIINITGQPEKVGKRRWTMPVMLLGKQPATSSMKLGWVSLFVDSGFCNPIDSTITENC